MFGLQRKWILKVSDLSYYHENGKGIKNISFELESGDFLAIIGKSGAGKSTLINSMLGIYSNKEGEVWIDNTLSAKDISFSSQNQAIDWYLNVFDNVYMEALFCGNKQAKIDTANVLNDIGLKGKEKEDPTNLSGGELQRIQLARQLVSNAKILILDEPTASLDVVTGEQIVEKLRNQTRKGKTCLIASHDLDMLEKYCNKVLYIENGEMRYFGEMTLFLERYNRFNEYKIFYEGNLPTDVEKKIYNSFNVLEQNPLTVRVDRGGSINLILKRFVDSGIVISSIEQTKHSLKETIQLRG